VRLSSFRGLTGNMDKHCKKCTRGSSSDGVANGLGGGVAEVRV